MSRIIYNYEHSDLYMYLDAGSIRMNGEIYLTEKNMKKIFIGLWGILQGVIGTAWSGLGLAFILHPDSGPGTKDWEEDQMFIPVGYIMIMIWLIIMFFSCYKLRKNKSNIIVFTITWFIGAVIYIFFVLPI